MRCDELAGKLFSSSHRKWMRLADDWGCVYQMQWFIRALWFDTDVLDLESGSWIWRGEHLLLWLQLWVPLVGTSGRGTFPLQHRLLLERRKGNVCFQSLKVLHDTRNSCFGRRWFYSCTSFFLQRVSTGSKYLLNLKTKGRIHKAFRWGFYATNPCK